ncbi:MAG: ribonuclease PH, partial [Pseudomonadota bacterium]
NVCAMSIGLMDNEPIADLNYVEDSAAHVDMNLVMTASKNLVEVQGTAEGGTFSKQQLDLMTALGEKTVGEIIKHQNAAIQKWLERNGKKYA